MTQVRQREQMLDDLARLAGESIPVEDAARHALELVGEAYEATASIIVLQTDDGFGVVAGPHTPEAIRATFSGLDPAESPLARRIREADGAFEIDLDDPSAPEWAERGRAMGLCVLRATPLRFGDRRIGAIVLLSDSDPDPATPFDVADFERLSRFVGMAVGSAQLRNATRRESGARAALGVMARIGGVVLSQMAEAIVTTDAARRVTAVNPAAERLYGFKAEDALGRPIAEVLEIRELDGAMLGTEAVHEAMGGGYWHGQVIGKPLIGSRSGTGVVVDLSLTPIQDEQRVLAGVISMSKALTPDDPGGSAASALGSLAVATSRARSRSEVAAAALERLCESTMADSGMIVTWTADGHALLEASRGITDDLAAAIRASNVPALRQALEQPGTIISLEALGPFIGGTDIAAALLRDGAAAGFIVDLRARDQSIGILSLGSRRPAWTRPPDEVVMQIASQVAGSLENAKLMERLELGLTQERRLTAQLETLMGLTLLPQGDISEEAIARLLLERIVVAIGADSGLVVRESANHFRIVVSRNVPEPMGRLIESRPADSFHFWRRLKSSDDGEAFQEQLSDLAAEEPDIARMIGSGVAAHAVFPVREGERLAGAFLCYFGGSNSNDAQGDDRNVEAVGRIISIAYANVRMSEGLADAAEHERRLTAELRALQELTLLGASTDDLARLAEETIEEVVLATGATGGGYILVDPASSRVDPIAWVGLPGWSQPGAEEPAQVPADWPSFEQLQSDDGIWLSRSVSEADGLRSRAQAVLPLRVDDRLAGVLHLEWLESPRIRAVRRPLPRADRPHLQHFAGQLPAALGAAAPCRGPKGTGPPPGHPR